MIIFHEGLPGSGKSYEAVVKHIFPALQARRTVYAYVEGLNHEKIASVLNLPLPVVQSLLIQVEREQVLSIHKLVADNSLVVIDELQNFWPVGKQRFGDDFSQFVTEHRHRGIDILAMGQDYRDAHALWKRRIDQLVRFMKLDMLGKSNSYKWTVLKAKSGEKFEQISTGVSHYDKKYFGTYQSHVSADTNTADYKDKRSVIWNSGLFRLGLVFVVVMLFLCVPYLIKTFDPERSGLIYRRLPVTSAVATAPVSVPSAPVPVGSAPSAPASVPPGTASPAKPAAPVDYVSAFVVAGARVRLVSVLAGLGRPPYVVIEFRDNSYRVQDRLDSHMLTDLGWSVDVVSLRLVRLRKKGEADMIVTAWPLEVVGEVSDRQNEAIRSRSSSASPRGSARPAASVADYPVDHPDVMASATAPTAPLIPLSAPPASISTIPTTPDGRIAWSASRVR